MTTMLNNLLATISELRARISYEYDRFIIMNDLYCGTSHLGYHFFWILFSDATKVTEYRIRQECDTSAIFRIGNLIISIPATNRE